MANPAPKKETIYVLALEDLGSTPGTGSRTWKVWIRDLHPKVTLLLEFEPNVAQHDRELCEKLRPGRWLIHSIECSLMEQVTQQHQHTQRTLRIGRVPGSGQLIPGEVYPALHRFDNSLCAVIGADLVPVWMGEWGDSRWYLGRLRDPYQMVERGITSKEIIIEIRFGDNEEHRNEVIISPRPELLERVKAGKIMKRLAPAARQARQNVRPQLPPSPPPPPPPPAVPLPPPNSSEDEDAKHLANLFANALRRHH